jgi:Tfp pilus assembly protein PilF
LLQADEGNPAVMREVSKFYLRQGNLEKAEQYLRDALSFSVEDKDLTLAYACLLCQLNRS